MKSRSLLLPVIALIVLVAIGSVCLILFSGAHDPNLTYPHAHVRSINSLRHSVDRETLSIPKKEANEVPSGSIAEDKDKDIPESEVRTIATSPPDLGLEATREKESEGTGMVEHSTPREGFEQRQFPSPTVWTGNKTEPSAYESTDAPARVNIPETKVLPGETIPPVPPVDTPEEPPMATLFQADVKHTVAAEGVEIYPFLKRYQTQSFKDGCIISDKRTTKGDIVRQVRKALQMGGFCEDNRVSSQVTVIFEAVFEAVSKQAPKFFIQHSSKSVANSLSHMVSYTWPGMLVLFNQLEQLSLPGASAGTDPASINQNLAYCHNSVPSNVIKTSGEFVSETSMDCYQYIETFEDYAADMLPFEFEESLGQAICRCNISWVPISLPNTAYFTVWGNSTDLLGAAMQTAIKTCGYRVQMPPKSEYLGRNKPISSQSTHYMVTRLQNDDPGANPGLDVDENVPSRRKTRDFSIKSPPSYYHRSDSSHDIGRMKNTGADVSSSTAQASNDITFQDIMAQNLDIDSKVYLLSSFAKSDADIIPCDINSVSAGCEAKENHAQFTIKSDSGSYQTLPTLYCGINGEITTLSEMNHKSAPVRNVLSGSFSRRSIGEPLLIDKSNVAPVSHLEKSTTMPNDSVNDSVAIFTSEDLSPSTRRLSALQSASIIRSTEAQSPVQHTGPATLSVFSKSPTKRPTSSGFSSSSNKGSVSAAVPRWGIVDDIKRQFGSPSSTGRLTTAKVGVNSLSSTKITPDSVQHGHISLNQERLTRRPFSNEWIISEEKDKLSQNIIESQSEKNDLFKPWMVSEGKRWNRTHVDSMFSASHTSISPSVEMSALGRANMAQLRDRERKELKRWVGAIALSYELEKGTSAVVSAYQPLPGYTINKRNAKSDKFSLKKAKISKSKIITVFGRHISMLSVKLAQALNSDGTVISVHTDTSTLGSHNDLIAMFGLKNKNIICYTKMDVLNIIALSGSQEKSSVSIFQSDVFVQVLTDCLISLSPKYKNSKENDDFDKFGYPSASEARGRSNDMNSGCSMSFNILEESIAVLLDMSYSTFFEIPSISRLSVILGIIAPECIDIFTERYSDIGDILIKGVEKINYIDGMMKVSEIPTAGGHGAPLIFSVSRVSRASNSTYTQPFRNCEHCLNFS